MNNAYKQYIDKIFDAYPFDNDAQREAVETFLNWLEGPEVPPEPTLTEYAEANHQYIVTWRDRDCLIEWDTNPDDIPADKTNTVLSDWADLIWDYTDDDTIKQALKTALENNDIDPTIMED